MLDGNVFFTNHFCIFIFLVVSSFHLDAFDNEAEGVAQVQERLKNIAKLLHANGGVFQAILDAAQFSEEKKQTLQKLLA